MITPGEHISIFGITGCGKSTLTRKIASLFPRRIVFDRLGEWGSAGAVSQDYESFRRLYQAVYTESSFTLILRPRPGISPEKLAELTDSILRLVYTVEGYNAQGIALLFEEVWLYAPLWNTPPWFLETLLTGRHHRISIVGNSQRPANVSKTLVSQSRHVFIGQFYEANDRKYYRDTLGERAPITPPSKFEFLWIRPDGPAQRVTTGPS